jgi:hypothetical protein
MNSCPGIGKPLAQSSRPNTTPRLNDRSDAAVFAVRIRSSSGRSSGRAMNARRGSSISWSLSLRSSRLRPARMGLPPSRSATLHSFMPSRARSRHASRLRPTCRASASSFRGLPNAPAAGRPGLPRSARMSPRRWRSFLGSGRLSSMSARSSPAGLARRSASRPPPSMCLPAALPARASWR